MKSKQIHKKVKTVCSACGKEFIVKPQTKCFPDGIHIDYFSCEYCKERYIYLVTDEEFRKQIKSRVFMHSAVKMKLRAAELKEAYADRVKEL